VPKSLKISLKLDAFSSKNPAKRLEARVGIGRSFLKGLWLNTGYRRAGKEPKEACRNDVNISL
jgi:hypothetical protein